MGIEMRSRARLGLLVESVESDIVPVPGEKVLEPEPDGSENPDVAEASPVPSFVAAGKIVDEIAPLEQG